MDIAKALQIINKAEGKNDSSLNFNNLGMTDKDLKDLLPIINEKLPQLKFLNLSNNQITNLPEILFSDSKIKIKVENNPLSAETMYEIITANSESIIDYKNLIPPSLYRAFIKIKYAKTKKRKSIMLSFLGLTGEDLKYLIRIIIKELPNLEKLDLSHNKLTSVLDEIGNFRSLVDLNLSHNKLTSVSDGIGNFGNLVGLNLSDNQLTSIPREIGNLGNLMDLSLGGNQLTSIPREIGNLEKLSKLYLTNNQLTSIPGEIGNLGNLMDLSLGSNQLTSIPGEIGNLGNLMDLSLGSNQLTSIPGEIGNLEKLSKLYLTNNQLTSIPGEIGNLGNLETLDLSYNQLTSVTEGIGNLGNLSRLDLEHNQLTSITEGIGNLGNLETLNLSYNQLIIVPDGIGNLGNLSRLDLEHNQLASLPEVLNSYNNSENRILIYNNPLTQETINWINNSAVLRDIISYDMAAHTVAEDYTKVLDRIYTTKSKEIQNQINTLTKDYTIFNGNVLSLKTGADVVKDFLGKAATNRLPITILDKVIKHYVDKALSDDEITKDTALSEMATALGNCETPVHSLILNKIIGLAQEDPKLFNDKTQLEAILERIAMESYLIKHPELLKNFNKNEQIEKIQGLLNSVYLEGAEDAVKYPGNKIKISGERTRLPSTSAYPVFAFLQILEDWVPAFAKICCQTDEFGELLKDDNQKYILDPHKLKVIKKQFMNDNNLGDSNVRVVLVDFNKKCEEELNKYAELVANMSSLSEEHKNMLTPNENKLNELLVNKKDEQTTEEIVDNCFKTYSDNIEKVLKSKSYKEHILKNMLEDKLKRLSQTINKRTASTAHTGITPQTETREITRSSRLSF